MQAWIAAAFASALFAGIMSVLAKCGVKTTDSDVATALRTCVVVVFTWVMVGVAGSFWQIAEISPKSWLFLVLSGLATGASWLFYYYALQAGAVSVVVQIDKLSLLVSIAFARLAFKERLTPKGGAGLAMLVAGTALVAACG